MVSVIGLESKKVQQLCDAANEEVDEKERVQIANFLCPISLSSDAISSLLGLARFQCAVILLHSGLDYTGLTVFRIASHGLDIIVLF